MQKAPSPSESSRNALVSIEHAGERLDVFLASELSGLSRSHAAQLLRLGFVRINDSPATRPSAKVAVGDTITVTTPPPPGPPQPESLCLDVVYEDQDVVVVNKPAGMVVHPAPGHPTSTLVNAILALHPEIECGDADRPGIVHRLDKETSGLLVVALHERVRRWLVSQFKTRAVHKEYVALVAGHPPLSGFIEGPIGRHASKRQRMAVVPGGRPASTEYEVVEYFDETALILARPLTGRTHQIRVHMDSIGHPVVGDAVYGGRAHRRLMADVLDRHFLHARKLEFKLEGWQSTRIFEAPLPPDLQRAVDIARLGQAS